MTTTIVPKTHPLLPEQKVHRSRKNYPLLLSFVEGATQEQQAFHLICEFASYITQQVEQSVPVSVVPHICYDDLASNAGGLLNRFSNTFIECLQQGVQRLLLVPWGDQPITGMLIEAATAALRTATGEEISIMTLPAPRVHVDGVSVRRALEGFASVQEQLSYVVEQFPGWSREYTCLSAGKAKIVLLRSTEGAGRRFRGNTLEMSAMKALTAALCPDHMDTLPASELYQWKRDGHIYAHYLVSLLSMVTEKLYKGV